VAERARRAGSGPRRAAACCALFLVGACAARAYAGPWIPRPGHFYLELRGGFATTATGYDPEGNRRQLRTDADDGRAVPTRLYDSHTTLYTEVGLATRLALVADLVMVRSLVMPRPGEQAREALGTGDLRAGLRLLLLDEEVSCALEAKLVVPTGASDGALPLGPGDLRGEAVLSIGHVWDRLPFFIVVELGARLRSSGEQRAPRTGLRAAPSVLVDYASELSYALELGYLAKLGPRFRITPRVSLDGRHGFTSVGAAAPASSDIDPVAPASVRLLRASASLGFGVLMPRRSGSPAAIGPMRVEVSLQGGGFLWGQGLPAVGELALAVGLSR